MTIHATLSGKLLNKGHRRGIYQARLDRCLDHLPEGHMVLGRLFDICNFGWRMGISRTIRKCHQREARTKCTKVETAELRLFSCNPKPAYVDIEILGNNQNGAQDSTTQRCSRVALPFDCIFTHYIVLNQLSHRMDTEQNHMLDVTVDLKNIRAATDDEQWDHGIGLPNIDLEIISKSSINKHLNKNAVFGIVSASCQKQRSVYSGSLVRLWAEQNPRLRYFLCRRCEDGRVIVKRCLNDAPMSETFGHILVGKEWTSVFLLELTKEDSKDFQAVDTIFLFIKIYEPDQRDLTFLDCFQVQKMMSVQKLLEKIIHVVNFPIRTECTAYVEKAEHCIKEITCEVTSLEEIGLHSGSNIIIRKKRPNEEVRIEAVQRDLRERHAEESERHEHAQYEIAKQEDHSSMDASIEACSNDADKMSSDCEEPEDEYDDVQCLF